MLKNVSLSLCVLNQWALDFSGNTQRIIRSIIESKKAGARYRLGPELELSGYGCEDHFHEPDTFDHSWECLAQILHKSATDEALQDIVCDIGMPVLLSDVPYNARVVLLNGTIHLIRPKMVLADGGLHRETRWFAAWPHRMQTVPYSLPLCARNASKTGQVTAPFGDALLRFTDPSTSDHVTIGLETCEELWTGTPPHLQMYSAGADVIVNASASHHELRKLDSRIDLVRMASKSSASGLYAYTNFRGCDSERTCYDGGAMAALCGHLVYLTKQFSLAEVEVGTVTVDVSEIRAKRIGNKQFRNAAAAAASVSEGGTQNSTYPILHVPFSVIVPQPSLLSSRLSAPTQCPEEEIALGPSLWMWDMLRRSRSSGFFLPLSGGLDSASVACIVLSLCNQICRGVSNGDMDLLHSCRAVVGASADYTPRDPRELCSRLFTTCYLPSDNSSKETELRATQLAESIGSRHLKANIQPTVASLIETATQTLSLSAPPRYASQGGGVRESLALQNVQARTRLVLSYLLAQLLPDHAATTTTTAAKHGPGGLLLLSAANLDEGLRGYMTKYDCSSADLNPIGSISKADLRRFVGYCIETLSLCLEPAHHREQFRASLQRILSAQPTAELLPLSSVDGTVEQTDEAEMGLTYGMLSLFGRLRKLKSCGPVSMLQKLLGGDWIEIRADIPADCFTTTNQPSPRMAQFLADKVKHFFRMYAINRHKLTVLPPAYHTEAYSADDNRFDLRPCLYPADWTHQFERMDVFVVEWMATQSGTGAASSGS